MLLAKAIFMPVSSVRSLEGTGVRCLRPVEVTHRLYGRVLMIEIVSRHDSMDRGANKTKGLSDGVER